MLFLYKVIPGPVRESGIILLTIHNLVVSFFAYRIGLFELSGNCYYAIFRNSYRAFAS